jgi:phosphatidylserine/phosphatidylglycerophosphate/cardiolipin synthase-like enzyme
VVAPIRAATSRSMNERIWIRTLTDGGQEPVEVAHEVAAFLDGAERTLDVAQYDFNLQGETGMVVGDAFRGAAARGVRIRFVYNVDHANPIPVPPPPEPDTRLIASLPVQAKAIAGIPDLMHHKFVVRDAADVWTGSTNWTDDSWSRQENVVVVVADARVAKAFELDFDQLWRTGDVASSGRVEPREVDGVRPWFTPGFGEDLSARIAKFIRRARRRVRICSPVITTGPVLGALAQAIADGHGDVAGCVDGTQVREVIEQWRANGNLSWKLPLLERVVAGRFSGKRSTPYGDGTLHDFMHAKVCVCDDVVFVGSFNLSRSGETNAENVLELHDAGVAERLATYVDEVRSRYPPAVTTTASGSGPPRHADAT